MFQFHIKFIVIFPLIHLLLTRAKCSDVNTNTNTDTTTVVASCPTQVCSYDDPITRYVKFPFQIKNESLPRTCGYPGFDLLCDGSYRLVINLPKIGLFYVQAINYISQEIWLNDPNNCLPRRLLSLNLSNFDETPFTMVQQLDQSYWLYNCSIDYFNSIDNVRPIPCLSSLGYGVFASTVKNTSNFTTSLCNYLGTVQIPSVRSQLNTVQSLDVGAGIQLSWAKPECKTCHTRNGRCGFKSYSSLEVGCFDVPHHGIKKETIVAITLAFAAPSLFFLFCILYYSMRAIWQIRLRHNAIGRAIAAIPARQPTQIGLETSVIESYPKVVLGESRRLPKPDEKSCPICLGEYLPKESLRSLPNCAHCFHADCVDEWLKLNASCPVCRDTPTNTPEITP